MLYVTTATVLLTAEELAAQPYAGFAVGVGCRNVGLPR